MSWLIPALLGCLVGIAIETIVERELRRREYKRLRRFVDRNRGV